MTTRIIKGWLVGDGLITLCDFQPSGKGIAELLASKDGWYEAARSGKSHLILARPDHRKVLIVGISKETDKLVSTTWTKKQVRKFVQCVP
jgi:hypothetical protein